MWSLWVPKEMNMIISFTFLFRPRCNESEPSDSISNVLVHSTLSFNKIFFSQKILILILSLIY